jgi:FkbH-like protein
MTPISVVADFNAELLSRYLEADGTAPECTVATAPFGQLFQTLAAFQGPPETVLVVWTRPEGVSPGWAEYLAGEPVGLERLLDEVDDFVAALKPAAGKARLVLVPAWVRTRLGRGLGLLDWSEDGPAWRLAQMNLRLARGIAGFGNAHMLDSQRWLDAARPARDSKYWYSIKSPFTEQVFKAAAQDVKAALRAGTALARKLLILDLDDTMWGGIVGDEGWENLRLGGHDAVGEAYADFQQAVRGLARRGIALAVVSKNDESVALAAMDSHPEMAIRSADLAGWRINWDDKAANIVALVEELNLGLEAAVFIDDNPAERGRVREALPQVLVPELPANPAAFADVLRQLDCFDQAGLTAEDRGRTDMYKVERSRRQAATEFRSSEDWLRSLDIRVATAPLGPANIKRVVQLLNKTNQMNLATRRLSEAELEAWLAGGEGRSLTALTVADRFGDLGLTGIVSWQADGEDLALVDFVLSCRAMGREVEKAMAHLAVEAARGAGKARVTARYLQTERNRPCLEFWQSSGFEEAAPSLFAWDAAGAYPLPEAVRIDADA